MKITSVSDFYQRDRNWSEVHTLIFSSGDMKCIPGNIGTFLPNLRTFKGYSSNLSFLKRSNFKFMRKLDELSLTGNQISSIDEDSFHDLPSLRYLYLDHNKIKFLAPKLLYKSKKLEFFRIYGNQIEIIPKDFFINNKKLKNVEINDNKLKTILVDFTKLKQLSHLDLAGNVCINQKIGGYFGPPFNPTTVAVVQAVINSNCTTRN